MPILGVIASGISGHLTPPWPANSYESIQTVTVGSGGSSSISFTSIPSTYTHLQVRMTTLPTSGVTNVNMTMNSDSGSNYTWHETGATGTSTFSQGAISQTFIKTGYSHSTTLYYTGVAIVDILDYKNTSKYKTARTMAGSLDASAGYIIMRSGLWLNTNAITGLTFVQQSGNFAQYTKLALYGIK